MRCQAGTVEKPDKPNPIAQKNCVWYFLVATRLMHKSIGHEKKQEKNTIKSKTTVCGT